VEHNSSKKIKVNVGGYKEMSVTVLPI